MPPQSSNSGMGTNQPNTTPINPIGTVMPQPPKAPQKSVGSVVGVVVIVLVLVLGGLYFWGQQLNTKGAMTPDEIRNTADASIANFQQQSTSDDISSIQADVDATNLDNLDKEIQDIGTALQ